MKHFLSLLLVLSLAPLALQGQNTSGNRIPDNDFYLMPSFAPGTIFFRGQSPARAMINICAVDQTLRFLDDNGTELSINDQDAIIQVQIDTVRFMRSGGAFYRMYPVTREIGIAFRRDTKITQGAKKGAFGMTDQTGSIQQYTTLYSDTSAQLLNQNKPVAYTVSEGIFFYSGDSVFKFNKASLKKVFPNHKDEIETYFKSGNKIPATIDAARALIATWIQ